MSRSISRKTALIIAEDPDVHAASVGPMLNGKFGLFIATYDESPSGFKRHRPILTSDGVYDTAAEATEAASKIISEVKSGPGDIWSKLV